jgi:glycosyltransferase involved in cell wall biosynthesis
MDAAFVTNIMAPYRLPLFRALHAALPGGIGVVCLAQSEPNRSWEPWREAPFPLRILSGKTIELGPERFLHLARGVTPQLADWSPRVVVVGGWDAPAYWLARSYAVRRGVPLLAWVETHLGSAGRGGVRRTLRGLFLGRADGVLACGTAAAAYAVQLGVPSERVAVVGNPVDTDAVAARARAFRASPAGQQLLEELPRPVFAYIGQLIPRKNVDALAHAWARATPDTSLLLAGRGEPPETLRTAANVGLLGELPPERVHELLGVVDVVALPSLEEVWGLIVNEALSAGALCVVSRNAGAAELVHPPSNGEIVDPSVDSIADALRRIAARTPLSPQEREHVAATSVPGSVAAAVPRFLEALDRFAGADRDRRRGRSHTSGRKWKSGAS